ncbi:DUF418 domain-containing protein [Paraurantiacibacter namhicola]|uniref:DUF418 domain-containing protein n=1 Tax=Paraurantiacibacter namhicola TaxID=645517 RepID=A0A1C7D8W5_9SPHN|nr:DUF418 domain-containing protein [Paraurantiacibacter namhicola]ANU07898.1 hypothetical protein A6F65_01599 [Paraurantiacibacter namhicola]
MATTAPPNTRIETLDIIRGIAVMGIFSVNVVGLGMVESAYFYPPDYGFATLGDMVMWALNFIFVDGRFRSLFSVLFGASMVLVIDRAVAAGRKGWKVHFPRMAALLAFGLVHFYFLWWGDILSNYALVGMIAYMFVRLKPKTLTLTAAGLFIFMYGGMTAGTIVQSTQNRPALTAEQTAENEQRLALRIEREREAHASPAAHLNFTLETQPLRPFLSVPQYGIETLALMLLGMALYKSGFLSGTWAQRDYVRIAAYTLVPMLLYHVLAAAAVLNADFARAVFTPLVRMLPFWFHPVGAIGYAALAILLFRSGALADRFAAVGRTAFSNYLCCTLVGMLLFFDFAGGLWGDLSRGQLWLIVPPVWALMLLWSPWWLARYRYGPLEWAWRSLSRWELQPMREVAAA